MATNVIDTDELRKEAYEQALTSYKEATERKKMSIINLGRKREYSGVYIEVR